MNEESSPTRPDPARILELQDRVDGILLRMSDLLSALKVAFGLEQASSHAVESDALPSETDALPSETGALPSD